VVLVVRGSPTVTANQRTQLVFNAGSAVNYQPSDAAAAQNWIAGLDLSEEQKSQLLKVK